MAAARSTLLVSVWFLLILPDIADVVFAEDGNWSKWGEWGQCSVTCGFGRRKRYRVCDDPPPSEDGEMCPGRRVHISKCRALAPCPMDGGWGAWTMWSQCSATCGQGTRTQIRECDNPPPTNGGKDCEGTQSQRIKCFSKVDCPVNGQWSTWSDWSSCSLTCGMGVRTRWRKCDNPPRQNGGLDCNRSEAGEMQEQSCNGTIVFCPANGGWSAWGEWGNCTSRKCGAADDISYVFRQRSCSNPYPAHKGTMCQGAFLNAAVCERPVNCPVDGQWSEWSDWKCQRFSVTRQRECNNPPPSNGGKGCSGSKVETFISEDEEYEQLCAGFQPESEEGGNDNIEASGNAENDEEYDYEDEEYEDE